MFIKKLFLAFFGLFWFGLVFAQSPFNPMETPSLTAYVTDFSSILSPGDLSELNTIARTYETQTTNQFVAVLFPDRQGNELFDIGMKIFNQNKIGQAGKNNGLLLLISTEEKKIRIIVGYGLEGDLPDALVSRIIEQDIRPLVNNGNFAQAVRVFYDRCSQAIDNKEASSLSQDTQISFGEQNSYLFWLGIVLGFVIATLAKIKKLNPSLKKIIIALLFFISLILVILLGTVILAGVVAGLIFSFTGFLPGRGGGGFGGGGSGGGGFSGGGGSSGGGGAGD